MLRALTGDLHSASQQPTPRVIDAKRQLSVGKCLLDDSLDIEGQRISVRFNACPLVECGFEGSQVPVQYAELGIMFGGRARVGFAFAGRH
jgi:hypothetical protein